MTRSTLSALAAFFAISACSTANAPPADAQSSTQTTENLAVETVVGGLSRPWGLVFLPNGDMLVTERTGAVQRVRGGAAEAVAGGPADVYSDGQSGVMDIALDPRFAENGFVYVSYMTGARERNNLRLFRARYDGERFVDGRVIFNASNRSGRNHPGGRMAFLPDETLLLVVGVADDQRDNAQDLSNHLGKILRLTHEGAAAPGNPFAGRAGAAAEIYTYGHRNPMGIVHDAATNTIWSHENGPRGGDELNRIAAGANYGWPLVTFGREYSGAEITDQTSAPGITDPVHQWTPSTAPSGMTIYQGDAFADWRGDLLIGFLIGTQVQRVELGAGAPQLTTLLAEPGRRIRDIRTGPDGFIYLLTDADDGAILRVRPAS